MACISARVQLALKSHVAIGKAVDDWDSKMIVACLQTMPVAGEVPRCGTCASELLSLVEHRSA